MVISVPRPGPEVGKTVRAAIKGWGPTLRLMAIMVTATACWIIITLSIAALTG